MIIPLAILMLIQIGLTIALARLLKIIVPEFHVLVRYGIAFVTVFMLLAMIVSELVHGVAA